MQKVVHIFPLFFPPDISQFCAVQKKHAYWHIFLQIFVQICAMQKKSKPKKLKQMILPLYKFLRSILIYKYIVLA